jgi:SP family arabinose:H+ symporter-like MFS transporter
MERAALTQPRASDAVVVGGRNTLALVNAAAVSALGGFLFGYDNIVISGAIKYLAAAFRLDEADVGWAAGCALIGCLAGSVTAGWTADRVGLKKSLMICAGCFAASSVGVFLCNSLSQFVCWRMVGGVGIGAASILAPMYIAEISPTRLRGRLVTLYQLGIVLGIFSAVFVNMLIARPEPQELQAIASGLKNLQGDSLAGATAAYQAALAATWNATAGWKWMFFAGIVPAVLFALVILPSRESPRWLMKAGRSTEASDVLVQINGAEIARAEAVSIQQSLAKEEGRFSELFTTDFIRALIIGVALAGMSQMSGITPLFSFLPSIFEAAGSATGDAFFQSVLVSLINTVFTLGALWLVDKTGRRSLILFGTTLQFLAFAAVGSLYYVQGAPFGVLAGVMAFVAGHAVGNGAVCWVIISEIFPTKVRGRAMSVAITSLWVFAYLGNQLFPLMQKYLGNSGTFWCFSAAALLNMLYVAFFVPETKGRSLEEIEKLWINP